MSNFLAVATVTAALRRQLQSTVGADVPGAEVRAGRPEGLTGGTPPTRVTIYLYQVASNGAFRNADLPTRTAGGDLRDSFSELESMAMARGIDWIGAGRFSGDERC